MNKHIEMNDNHGEYNVLVNNKEHIKLNMLQHDIKNLTAKDLRYKKSIAYHQFSYDTKFNQYKSIKNNNNNSSIQQQTILDRGCLFSSNLKYKHETGFEMCFLTRETNDKSISIWSWEFDNRLKITSCFINLLFMIFDQNGIINWYIDNNSNDILLNKLVNQKQQNHDIVFEYVESNFTLLPLELPTPVYFDKKLDISNYFKLNNNRNNNENNRFFIACIMDKNKSDRTQLFRTKSINHDKIGKSNPNQHNDQVYEFPFTVYFELSPTSTSTTSETTTTTTTIPNDKLQNSKFYFNEETEIIKNLKKLKSSKIYKWDCERVLQWLFDLSFYELILIFKELQIDGLKLLSFQIELLPISFTDNQIEKNRFIQELSKLILISGNKNELSSKSTTSTVKQYSNFKNQYQIGKSTTLVLGYKNNMEILKYLEKRQLARDIDKGNIKLLNDESSYDFKFIIQDRILRVHKSILISSSDYFKSVLSSNIYTENKQGEIIFQEDQDLTFNSLKNLFELIYMDQQHLQHNKQSIDNNQHIQFEFLKSLSIQQLKSILILSDRFLLSSKFIGFIENFIILSIDSANIESVNQQFNFNDKIYQHTLFSLKYFK